MDEKNLWQIEKAQGCLIGQCAGDNLGALVEFLDPTHIAELYPEGVRHMKDGGTWKLLAGQPTDDTEMALALARTLIEDKKYDKHHVYKAYLEWYDSNPFDCGTTIANALQGRTNKNSQANGALMRISPLGIFYAGTHGDFSQSDKSATEDAMLTHPNKVCVDINILYVRAIITAISNDVCPNYIYKQILSWCDELDITPAVMQWTTDAAHAKPETYTYQMGWVRIAWQNALYQLLHAPSVKEAIVDTIAQGGDTDTNAAICGALLGAVYGVKAIPTQWVDTVINCAPSKHNIHVHKPRPERYWPSDAMVLAEQLLQPKT